MERRYITTKLNIGKGKKQKRMIDGYGAVFNEESKGLPFVETIRPGAFTKTLREADIRSLFNHDANLILGRNVAGTLRLEEDDTGLRYECDPPNNTWANDLAVSMRRGDVSEMSFMFDTIKDEWHEVDGITRRELLEVRLWEVGPVTFAAYPQTTVQARSAYYKQLEKRGANLAALLNRLIEQMLEDDPNLTRADIVADMAEEAGDIDPDTVNQILRAAVDCPPLVRLEGFARVLPATLDQLIAAAESDGCDYGDERSTEPGQGPHSCDCQHQKTTSGLTVARLHLNLNLLELGA